MMTGKAEKWKLTLIWVCWLRRQRPFQKLQNLTTLADEFERNYFSDDQCFRKYFSDDQCFRNYFFEVQSFLDYFSFQNYFFGEECFPRFCTDFVATSLAVLTSREGIRVGLRNAEKKTKRKKTLKHFNRKDTNRKDTQR